jgi:hypothetical protein
MNQSTAPKPTNRFGHHNAERDSHGKLEVTVKGKEDEEDQHYRQRTDDIELLLGSHILAVFPAPAAVKKAIICPKATG